MKRTSLFDAHRAAGATLVPFAGWEMPVSYAGTVSEVKATRTAAGLFDVSHMGEVRVSGPGAFDYLQSVTANDISRLRPGQAQYSLLLNESGGVTDDIIVYQVDTAEYMLVLNAGCKDKDWAWLQEQAISRGGVTLEDISDATALLAVQGPEAVSLVRELTGAPDIPRFHFQRLVWQGLPLTLSRTGYTGEDGFEIFCPWQEAQILWNALMEQGATPCGLGARDVLRLEAAYPLYGHELDAETCALECGVGWAIKIGKGAFVGRDALVRAKTLGIPRRLAGLRMVERAIPREGCLLFDPDGTEIGRVTSGTFSPSVGAGIALARIDTAFADSGREVLLEIRGRRVTARITPLPFFRNGV